MVKIVHSFKNLTIEKNVKEDISFILTNKKGSYVYLAEKPESKYQGMFFFNNFWMYKVIENINLIDNKATTEIKNNFYSIDRKRKNTVESFFMPYGSNSLVYELNKKKEIEITLDVKKSYDNRIWGRYYEILEEKDCIVIKFTKKTDNREDSSDEIKEYVIYLVIKSKNNNFDKIEKWVKRYYKLDEQRNSIPFTRYVFCALKLKGEKFVFSISKDKENAIKECKYIFSTSDKLKQKQKKYFVDNILKNKVGYIKNKKIKFAFISAIHSLDNLTINFNKNYFVLAGLPWFFQIWARDELISLKALMLMKKNYIAKNILNRQIADIKDDSTISNKNNNSTNSADALGWLFKRLEDFKKLSREKIKLPNKKSKNIVDPLVTKYTLNNFAINYANETWMDSLGRSGVRIEIQALRSSIYQMLHSLTKQKIYKYLEEKLKNNIKEKLWNEKCLYDGLNDTTIRPNVFIAYYIYPNLLTKKQWIKCFETILKALWLEWGGIATIDKNNPSFCNEHTGEIAKSYHNGDSWFWINNLAALVLYKLDKNKFRRYINKILKASTNEILWKGAISQHSELSSASNLKSQGCLMQAWSNAMYIELVSEMFDRKS